ncbi:MAG: hypothetical protein QOF76_3048 [Solirubrobacteraceae bacterium]|jgi:F420-dependent oxidoreductase-like protein|nr:hypothetical protein [Solirubrobacteraceae bacterium]
MTRFGLQLPSFSFGGPDAEIADNIFALARAADEAGYDSLWVMDHFYQLDMLGGDDFPMLEGYTLLGALAAITENVDLGTLVTGVTYRNPALLAQEVITLDVLSKGRAWLGIGAAWHENEHRGHGVDFPRIGVRMDMLEEAVQICRAMFDGDKATFDGKHFKVEEVRVVPAPIRDGGPPIMIAGGGEKRTLKLVAQYADACNIFGDELMVQHKLDVLRRHCDDVGRDFDEISITRLATMLIADDEDQSVKLKAMILEQAGEERAPAMQVGTESEIEAQLHGLKNTGVDHFIFNMPGQGPETVHRAAELLKRTLG